MILSKKSTPIAVAKEFILSTGFTNKKYDNMQFLHRLYRTFFGRDEDTVGMNYWLTRMNAGLKRDKVLEGFAASDEFKKIVASFGLNTTTNNTKKKKK